MTGHRDSGPPPTDPLRAPSWTHIDWTRHVHDCHVHGLRIRYLDCGSGPALVLLHGIGGCWQWWLENIPTLAQKHRVIAVDLPGFGHSERLPPPGEMRAHANAVIGLLDELNVRSATTVGHSMGGLVAVAMATSSPRRVENLVLVNAGGVPIGERRLKGVLAAVKVFRWMMGFRCVREGLASQRWLRQILLRPAFRDPRSVSPALARHIMPLTNAPGFVDAIAAANRGARDVAPEAIACRVLLVWGERDVLVPARLAEDFRRRLPTSELVLLADVGHCPMIEVPGLFNRAVLDFTQADV